MWDEQVYDSFDNFRFCFEFFFNKLTYLGDQDELERDKKYGRMSGLIKTAGTERVGRDSVTTK